MNQFYMKSVFILGVLALANSALAMKLTKIIKIGNTRKIMTVDAGLTPMAYPPCPPPDKYESLNAFSIVNAWDKSGNSTLNVPVELSNSRTPVYLSLPDICTGELENSTVRAVVKELKDVYLEIKSVKAGGKDPEGNSYLWVQNVFSFVANGHSYSSSSNLILDNVTVRPASSGVSGKYGFWVESARPVAVTDASGRYVFAQALYEIDNPVR